MWGDWLRNWGSTSWYFPAFEISGGTQIADLFTENLTVSYCMVFKMFRDRDEGGVWNPLKKIDTDTIKIYQLESHRIFVWCNFSLPTRIKSFLFFFQPTCSLFQILGLTWWISAAFDRRWLHGKLSTGHCFLLVVRFVLVDFTGSRSKVHQGSMICCVLMCAGFVWQFLHSFTRNDHGFTTMM